MHAILYTKFDIDNGEDLRPAGKDSIHNFHVIL
jgi:hypothetical protein